MAATTGCKFGCLLALGIVIVFIGFVMTMYGYLHKPFFSDDSESWCDFCKDDNSRDRQNIKNTKVAGPIFLGLGIIVIICTVLYRKSKLKERVNQGINATASYGGAVTGYSSVGQSEVQPVQQSFPPSASYPKPNNPYPQQQAPAYPPPTQPYHTQTQPYPAAQPYPTYQPQYPPAPQQSYSQPPQATPYPSQTGGYPQQAGPIPTKSEFPPPPSYNEATVPSAPPS